MFYEYIKCKSREWSDGKSPLKSNTNRISFLDWVWYCSMFSEKGSDIFAARCMQLNVTITSSDFFFCNDIFPGQVNHADCQRWGTIPSFIHPPHPPRYGIRYAIRSLAIFPSTLVVILSIRSGQNEVKIFVIFWYWYRRYDLRLYTYRECVLRFALLHTKTSFSIFQITARLYYVYFNIGEAGARLFVKTFSRHACKLWFVWKNRAR